MNHKPVCEKLFMKTDGFIKGICHPKGETTRLTDAGIGWIRTDAPYPLDETGDFSESHREYLATLRHYAENGLRSIVVSPYPDQFIARGIDPRTPEGQQEVRAVCAKMARDYAPYRVCWQATNEMHIVHFRSPLTAEESKEFLIATLQGLREGDPHAIIGHNSVSHTGDWNELCREIDRRTDCDYLGFDLYNGTWSNGGPETYLTHIDELHALVNKPIILMEFGFSSSGGNVSADQHEITDYIAKLGYQSLDELFASPDRLIEHLPISLKTMVLSCAPEDKEIALRNCFPHLLKCWCAEEVFPHTEEGQALFYRTLLPQLLTHPYLAGAVIYCWRDSTDCFSCGAPDCPCETAWGLSRLDGTTKLAYDAVRALFR